MEHFFQTIQGWFTFPTLYRQMVKKFNRGSTFVEVGTWKGKSASYMAVEIINSKKDIDFYCVDTWEGSSEHKRDVSILNNTLFDEFMENIESVSSTIHPIRLPSVEASATFQDNSIDFIFIDAAHDYESVKADMEAWYPKLKSTGVFAGHDYIWAGVKKAVEEFCLTNNLQAETFEECWVIRDNTTKSLS